MQYSQAECKKSFTCTISDRPLKCWEEWCATCHALVHPDACVLSYGQCPVPSRPDNGSLSVYLSQIYQEIMFNSISHTYILNRLILCVTKGIQVDISFPTIQLQSKTIFQNIYVLGKKKPLRRTMQEANIQKSRINHGESFFFFTRWSLRVLVVSIVYGDLHVFTAEWPSKKLKRCTWASSRWFFVPWCFDRVPFLFGGRLLQFLFWCWCGFWDFFPFFVPSILTAQSMAEDIS